MKKKLLFLLGWMCASLLSAFGAYQDRPYDLNFPHYSSYPFVPGNSYDAFTFEKENNVFGIANGNDSAKFCYMQFRPSVFADDFDTRDLEYAKAEIVLRVSSSMSPDSTKAEVVVMGQRQELKGGEPFYYQFNARQLEYYPKVEVYNYRSDDTLWVEEMYLGIKMADTTYVNIPVIMPNNPEWGSVSDSFMIGTYYANELIDIDAVPNPGYQFVGWTDKRVTSRLNYENVDIDTLIAIFEPIDTTPARDSFNVTVIATYYGYVDTLVCGSVSGERYYFKGDSLRLVAEPAHHYKFDGFTSANGYSTTVATAADTIYARFVDDTVYVCIANIISNDTNLGTVSQSQLKGIYYVGDTLNLQGVPVTKPGCFFMGWSCPEVENPLPCAHNFVIDTLVALFDTRTHIDGPGFDSSYVSNQVADLADPIVSVCTIEGRVIRANVRASQALVGLKKGYYVVGRKKVRVEK